MALVCHVIEVEGTPSTLLDEGAAVGKVSFDADAADLLARYAKRAEAYAKELDAGKSKRWGPVERRPGHTVKLAGRTITLLYDEHLDRQLLEIYVTDGWAGIREVQVTLARVGRAAYPWNAVQTFFRYTRNMLALLIRNALDDLERRANADIVRELSLSAVRVNDAWNRLDVKPRYYVTRGESFHVEDSLPPPGTYSHAEHHHSLGNRELSAKLYAAITDAVEFREQEEARERQARIQRLKYAVAVGSDEGTSAPTGIVMDIAADEAWLTEYNQQLELLYAPIQALCDLAVLAIPLLHKGFEQTEMEDVLGAVLLQFHGESERLAIALNKQLGWIDNNVPGLTRDTDMEKLYDASVWIEQAIIKLSLARSSDDHGYLSMLSEPTLRRLVDTGVVAKDSFAWIVLSRYISELIVEIDEERERDNLVESLVHNLTKLVVLFTLVATRGRGTPVARGVAGLLNIGLLYYQAHSISRQLAALDRELAVRLVELDRDKADELMRVTELAQIRREWTDSLKLMVVKEIVLIAAAQRWALFKQFTHLRCFYYDLEILVG